MTDLDIHSSLGGIINLNKNLIGSAQDLDKRDCDNDDKISADTQAEG
jgi:hypothetical protein